MSWYQGRLVNGDVILTAEIEIWIEIDEGTGRLYSWSGSFELPNALEADTLSNEHSQCEIVLADGRRGTICLTHLDGVTVQFQGSGPLAR